MIIEKRINKSWQYFTLLDVDSIVVSESLSMQYYYNIQYESNRTVKIVSKFDERDRGKR